MGNAVPGNFGTMTEKARTQSRKRYADDHFIRSKNHEKAIRSYLEQQSKTYSRTKNAFIMALLGNLHHRRFLDYGCGPGLFLRYAATSGASCVVGVDIEEPVLSTARWFLEKMGMPNRCLFLVSNRFPVFSPEFQVDAVLLKDVLEHVEDDQALLNAAAKAIASDGIVVISTQNAFSLNFLVEGTYQRIFRHRKDWYGWDPTHLRFYTPKNLMKKLETAGLRCIEWRSIYLIPNKIPVSSPSGRRFFRIEWLTQIDRLLGRFFPWNRLGWNIIVKAVKFP